MNIIVLLVGLLFTLSMLASVVVMSALIVSGRAERAFENLAPPVTAAAAEEDGLPDGVQAQSAGRLAALERSPHTQARSRSRASVESA